MSSFSRHHKLRWMVITPAAIGIALLFCLDAGAQALQAHPQAQAAHPQTTDKDSPGPPPDAKYVGSETCRTCHEPIVKAGFDLTPHGRLVTLGKHGCEDCHGPGSAHVEGGGDKSKIFRFKDVSPALISDRCLSCHQKTQEHGNWTRSLHAKNGLTCTSCHSPHYAKVKESLLAMPTPKLCYGCHNEQRADFERPFHHKVNEGLIKCQDCHNVHGSFAIRSLRASPDQQVVCLNCHRDKQGPFLFEHPPVKFDGCTSCHTPHGSVNARLLRVAPVNVLCMQCHTPANLAAAPGIPSFHNQTQKYQACTLCHPAIHGSNAAETFEY